MAYDFEKYRGKREKVLRGGTHRFGAGGLALLAALVVLVGLAGLILPRSVAFLKNRDLDDAIFKVGGAGWSHGMLREVEALAGVASVAADSNGQRLVVTYRRSATDPAQLAAFLHGKGVPVVLLNTVGHDQRLHGGQ